MPYTFVDRSLYMMGRDKDYPTTEALEMNCARLLFRVNGLLRALDPSLTSHIVVSSGYRPGKYNKAAGGSERSAHITCEAIDLLDTGNKLGKSIIVTSLLKDFDLYMEDPGATAGWLHLQSRPVRSGNRVFKP